MSHILRRLSEYVCRHPWLAIAVFVVAYGIRTNDEVEFRTISAAPFGMNLPPDHQFLYGSPFTFFVGSYYLHHGLDDRASYFVVHLLGVVLFFVALRKALARGLDDEGRRLATIVMLSSPLLFVVLSWIGKSDAYLLAFFLLLTMTASAATQVILCALMVLCHREMGAAVLVAYLFLKRRSWRAIVLGLALGEIALLAYTRVLLSSVPESRITYAVSHASMMWSIFWSHPLLHLLASFGPFWVYVVTRKTLTPAAGAVFVAALVLSIVSQDFTRVFVIVSTPLLLEMTREAVAELTQRGGIAIGGYRLGIQALWPLMFVQVQLAGPKLLWARGVDIVLGS